MVAKINSHTYNKIIDLHIQGVAKKQIATQVDASLPTVYKYTRLFNEQATETASVLPLQAHETGTAPLTIAPLCATPPLTQQSPRVVAPDRNQQGLWLALGLTAFFVTFVTVYWLL